jgi:Ca2+-binding RTX toxin-like protein
LQGDAGDDILVGNGGNDTLVGMSGADHMEGGLGNDTYFVHDSLDTIIEEAGEGRDALRLQPCRA